jgi:signal transduction histidine kinase
MPAEDEIQVRAETDASLRAERQNTDHELSRRAQVVEVDADKVLSLARERADRLLAATRAAADARLPLSEQTEAAVAFLLAQRGDEDAAVADERTRADTLLDQERNQLREKLSSLLVLERQTTDLHLALERRAADRAVSARDEFLAQASHDLRALMATNKLYLSLLAKETSAGKQAEQFAKPVAALVQIDAQLDRLVSDLVDVVAIEAGKLTVAPSSRSAADLLSTAVAVFEPLARAREQSLSITQSTAGTMVLADATRALQVLGNLLSNAIKFTPPGGEIRVGFEATGDEVTFFVADSGPGVPAARAPLIFDRFVGSSGGSGGLGLGLFIASRLVRAHDGRLWLDSRSGQGAVFRFTLRRAGS